MLKEATSADVGLVSGGSGREFWPGICCRRLPSSFVISPSPVRFPETELFSEGYVTSPPTRPPPLSLGELKDVSVGLSQSRELHEEHRTASQLGPRGKGRPSVSSSSAVSSTEQ